MRVSSASLAGSLGGGIAVPILSRLIARAVCGDISLPSKRLACSSQLLSWVRTSSLDLSAISLLSSVMYVLEIHCAVETGRESCRESGCQSVWLLVVVFLLFK